MPARLADIANPEQAGLVILEALAQRVADMLQIPFSEVDTSRPLHHYGVDSLVVLKVRNWITREPKANIALLEILDSVSMAALATKIAQKSKLVTASD
jgi:zearalenone synthase (highly reducing iterative type I polyketide synthase)